MAHNRIENRIIGLEPWVPLPRSRLTRRENRREATALNLYRPLRQVIEPFPQATGLVTFGFPRPTIISTWLAYGQPRTVCQGFEVIQNREVIDRHGLASKSAHTPAEEEPLASGEPPRVDNMVEHPRQLVAVWPLLLGHCPLSAHATPAAADTRVPSNPEPRRRAGPGCPQAGTAPRRGARQYDGRCLRQVLFGQDCDRSAEDDRENQGQGQNAADERRVAQVEQ